MLFQKHVMSESYHPIQRRLLGFCGRPYIPTTSSFLDAVPRVFRDEQLPCEGTPEHHDMEEKVVRGLLEYFQNPQAMEERPPYESYVNSALTNNQFFQNREEREMYLGYLTLGGWEVIDGRSHLNNPQQRQWAKMYGHVLSGIVDELKAHQNKSRNGNGSLLSLLEERAKNLSPSGILAS